MYCPLWGATTTLYTSKRHGWKIMVHRFSNLIIDLDLIFLIMDYYSRGSLDVWHTPPTDLNRPSSKNCTILPSLFLNTLSGCFSPTSHWYFLLLFLHFYRPWPISINMDMFIRTSSLRTFSSQRTDTTYSVTLVSVHDAMNTVMMAIGVMFLLRAFSILRSPLRTSTGIPLFSVCMLSVGLILYQLMLNVSLPYEGEQWSALRKGEVLLVLVCDCSSINPSRTVTRPNWPPWWAMYLCIFCCAIS